MLSTWKKQRALVTGHTGFKGSWLCLMLKRLGAEVFGIGLDPVPEKNLFTAAKVAQLLSEDHRCNICDSKAVGQIVNAINPTFIFHLAAQALVLPSYQDPVTTIETNVMGTAHVLSAALECNNVRGILVITTDKVYENLENGRRYQERDPLGGHDPYSASKAAAEIVAASFRHSLAGRRNPPLAIASARSGNVIGGGDWAQYRLIPDCIRAFSDQRPVRLRNPESVRPWQHVLEPLSAYISLGQHLAGDDGGSWAESWNFGPAAKESFSVIDMAKLAAETWGDNACLEIAATEDKPHEANLLHLDASKARRRLQWTPRWNAERAVVETISWYRDVAKGYDARKRCLEQIESHEAGP